MIVAKIDTRGFGGVLHEAGVVTPTDFHFWHHLEGFEDAEIRVHVQEETLIVVSLDNREGAQGTTFVTREQARDLLDKLATALAGEPREEEPEPEDDDATRIEHTTDDEDAPEPVTYPLRNHG